MLYSWDHSVLEGMTHIALLNSAMLQTSDTTAAVTSILNKSKPLFHKL